MVDPAGKKANKNGKWLEKTISNLLTQAGYYELSSDERKKFLSENGSLDVTSEHRWFVEQVAIHRNIYDAKWKLDFFIFNQEKYPDGLYIESKWQGTQGSVDEKYVFTVLSLKDLPQPSMLILDGGGARQGAIKWIKNQSRRSNQFTFFTFSEFLVWARDHI